MKKSDRLVVVFLYKSLVLPVTSTSTPNGVQMCSKQSPFTVLLFSTV